MNKYTKSFTLVDPSRMTGRTRVNKAFTLIELLVVISIIALLSSVVMSAVMKARIRARDSQRIQNARQIAIALEQYESTFNTYKVANSGLTGNNGSGYVAKSGGSYSANSILSALKSAGLYTNTNLTDPVFGDNYYLGLCTSTNAYNVFVKMEQPGYSSATSSISNTCGGTEASTLGFSFIASTAGGSSGGGGVSTTGGSGFGGAYESGASAPGTPVVGPDGLSYVPITAEDGRVWLDRNLGATRAALYATDTQAYGHYYQWGRGIDGHQVGTSLSTSTLSSIDAPVHSNFIYTSGGNYDWRSPQNVSLWQGINGINNPCPTGFRIPSTAEWQTLGTYLTGFTTATCGGSSTCINVGYNTSLKFPAAGIRNCTTAAVQNIGSSGSFWSSTVNSTNSNYFVFSSNSVTPASVVQRSFGIPIRCIKN